MTSIPSPSRLLCLLATSLSVASAIRSFGGIESHQLEHLASHHAHSQASNASASSSGFEPDDYDEEEEVDVEDFEDMQPAMRGRPAAGPSQEEMKAFIEDARQQRTAKLRQKLEDLVGLDNVKTAVDELIDLVGFSKERVKMGEKSLAGQSLHMRFLGNPGTGKTVVARIVGELLLSMGAITPKGQTLQDEYEYWQGTAEGEDKFIFKEVSRADLVAEYKGQTAPKVQNLMKSVMGGVLFIDEAYSLVQSGRDSFGVEAVDTLIKEMEDQRAHVVVILAGYRKEMDDFFNSNPGFPSRVPYDFQFEDYSCNQLTAIGKIILKSKGMFLKDADSSDAGSASWWLHRSAMLSTQCCNLEDQRQCKGKVNRANGNGRTVRNILEASFRQMSVRVLKQNPVQELQKFAFAMNTAPAEWSCDKDIEMHSYKGPDMRCELTTVQTKDLTTTILETLNLNIAACRVKVNSAQIDALVKTEQSWTKLAAVVGDVSETRSKGGDELAEACNAVTEVLAPLEGLEFLQLDERNQVNKSAAVERRTQPDLTPRGYTEAPTAGYCRTEKHTNIRAQKKLKGIQSIDECAEICTSAEKGCTGVAYHAGMKKCEIYLGSLPVYANGRSGVRCLRNDAAKGAGHVAPVRGQRAPVRARPKPPPKAVVSTPGLDGRQDDKAAQIRANNAAGIKTTNAKADALMEELNGLVGLAGVKAGMGELRAMVEFDKWRSAIVPGSKSLMGQSVHMQFLGNPGTGKTVVARIVGKLLVEMGVIKPRMIKTKKAGLVKKEIFVEVSRADLVAEYVGQTAPRVINAVDKARGGILFVDEAYALKKEGGRDTFGQEAVDTLIAQIENKRDKMIAIFAGYEREMEAFFDSNPGFKSRVPFKFYFDDYTCTELSQMSKLFTNKKKFSLSVDAQMWLTRTISYTTGCCETKDCESTRDNGNGRTVRNILEATYRNFAARVVPTMWKSDVRAVLDQAERFAEEKEKKRPAYETQHGSSAERHLEKEFGKGALCDPKRKPPGNSMTWADLCDKAETYLRQLEGEDVLLVTASKAVDALLPSCRDDRVDVSKLEDKLIGALQVTHDPDDWEELMQAGLSDEDCGQTLEKLDNIIGRKGNPGVPSYDTESIMREEEKLQPVMDKLGKLVGLDGVKSTMGKLYGLTKISRWRSVLGLGGLDGQSFHMRFLGNPGTGKTVVARIVGDLLTAMQVVSMPESRRKEIEAEAYKKMKDEGKKPARGQKIEIPPVFNEVSRAELVASYSGQTAPRVEKAVHKSLGGVLFIDEAYSIVRGGEDAFGQEAVDTLIKEMEDKRDNVVVILAGYEEEMDSFFDSNPGFKSRVPLNFRFEDYSCIELSKISHLVLKGKNVQFGGDKQQTSSYLDNLIQFSSGCCENVAHPDCHPSRENGNGRTVRNIVEALTRTMATRVMNEHKSEAPDYAGVSKDDLTDLMPADIQAVAEEQAEIRLKRPCGRDGLLEELKFALNAPGGFRDWYRAYGLANPIKAMHTVLRETDRAADSLKVFTKSKDLGKYQENCVTRLGAVKVALDAKVHDTCGSASKRGGYLKTLADGISEKTVLSVEQFKAKMEDISTTAMEAELLQRVLAEDAPKQLKDLKPSVSDCAAGVQALKDKSLLVPLQNAVGMLGTKKKKVVQEERPQLDA